MDRIAAVRCDSYPLVDQEVETGLRSIAVPLVDGRGRTVAALNTGMAATQVEPESLVASYLPQLLGLQQSLQRVI